jgi:phenylalanyl-tRNA synthetase beta chain
MPMTEDKAVMRESVLNGVVDAIDYNKTRKNENLAFFEIANVHTATTENLHLGIALNGLFESHLWKGQKQVAEFYFLNGIVDDLFEKLNFHVSYEPYIGIEAFHPGRCARLMHNGKQIGVLGELHP